MLSLKSLEAFYWVARQRSFHAAAERLCVTQPSVSYRIKELEQQLGRALFIRAGRNVRLTRHGQALLHHAERMFEAAQDLDNQFRSKSAIQGNFRIGVTDAFSVICLPDLESVRRLHEGLQSFLSMRRMEARRRKARALLLRFPNPW